MRISGQASLQLIKLINEATGLDPHDLETFYRWVQASYEALEFDPVQQRRFDEYCRSSHDSSIMRLLVGTWMLRQSFQMQGGRDVCADPACGPRTQGPTEATTSVKGNNSRSNEFKAWKQP